MKKKITLPVIAVLALMMAGCPQKKEPEVQEEIIEEVITKTPNEKESLDSISNEVALTLEQVAYDNVPKAVHLTITNQSSVEVSTGSDYSINVLKGDFWEVMDMEGIGFDRMIHPIGPGEGVGFDIDLFTKEFKYDKGTYKIIKQLGNDIGSFTKEVEFVIK
ncbi:immunoglobulin-like domain-containing protein [Myroides odoratimimus]|uniref:immunoglobulin-like domain-containing protein n=1 Tax=Myroides odoratimimus TaxID=76832 RepID=UPI00046AD3F0|nr:immunoglobulin-like domain-containing protein [Myroides odoratimimus]